jgi:superfamily I DNA/RNA helicase
MMAVENLFEAERKSVINHHRGPAIIVAGPGTGKTTVLAERIVSLCRQDGGDPTRIVAVTFTNHAANQMKEKVAERFGENGPPSVYMGTLHAFAKRILHRYSDQLRLPSSFRVVGSFQEDILLADARFELKNRQLNLGRSQNKFLSRFKAGRALVPDLDAVNKVPDPKAFGTQQQFDECYQSLLSYYHSLDWYDVVALAVKVLQNDDHVFKEVSGEIDHLLVDEYQDLNRADHELIRLMAMKKKSLMVFGDDDQSIYQTGRFANPGGVKRFTDIYPGAQVYPLSFCWRCGSSILNSAWKLIDQGEMKMPERMPKKKPVPDPQRGKGTFEIKSLKSEKAEIETVLFELGKELKGTEPPTDILILFHSKEIGFKYVDAMKSAELEFQNLLGQSAVISRALTPLYEMLRLFNDETDNLAGRYLLEKFFMLDSSWIARVKQASLRTREPLWRAAVRYEGAPEIVKAWEQKLQRWRQADDVAKVLNDMIQDMGIREEPGIENIQEWCKSREKPDIKSMIERMERGFDFAEPPQEESTGRSVIKVMTMHGAKGIDGDVVFVPALEDELIPDEWYEPEQRRLLYVAMTRAKRRLLLSWAWSRAGKATYRNSRRAPTNRRRSRFLADID